MLLLMLISLLLLIAFLYTPIRSDTDTIIQYKRELQKYSGFQPDLFRESMNFMELFQNSIHDPEAAAQYLYDAIERAETMKLYASPEYHDEIHESAKNMAIEGERLILDSALAKGIFFRTTYLKESYDY